ncbi:hypothetical protein M9Y10_029073 [Tritrichomonas musculus]|uniref:Uncharacterized protein n=1 Tax=Tritrichomonas musculus TaxID=1915356 RepID=A0ABR2KL99_9EUKA
MARTRRDGRRGGKRPIPPPQLPRRYSSSESDSDDERSSEEETSVQATETRFQKRKLHNKRWKRLILTRKMDHILKMCEDYEPLADSVLDYSAETDHYHVPIRAFQGEWNAITTMQYALESLQHWIAFGEEVQKIGTVSDDPEPEQNQQVSEVQEKFFKISSSSEEEN